MKVPTWILTTPTVQRLHHPIKITGGKRWQKVKSSKRWLIRPPQKWENIINQSSIINLKSSTLNHPSSILNHDFFFHIINVIRHVPGKPPIIVSSPFSTSRLGVFLRRSRDQVTKGAALGHLKKPRRGLSQTKTSNTTSNIYYINDILKMYSTYSIIYKLQRIEIPCFCCQSFEQLDHDISTQCFIRVHRKLKTTNNALW